MSTTHANHATGEDTLAPVEPGDVTVEFSALGKSPTEARVELFSSLARLEPTTVTGRMLEQAPEPFEPLAGRLPYLAVASLESLPFAVDEPVAPERLTRRRPVIGVMAATVMSAGFAVTLFAGPGVGSSGADRSFSSAPRSSTAEFGAPLGTGDALRSWGSPRTLDSSDALGSPGTPGGPVVGRADGVAATTTPQPARALFAGGRLILTGSVSSRSEGDALVARASEILGPDAVDDQLVVNADAPRVTALPVQVAERVRFAPGSTAIDGDYVALVSAWRDVLAAVPSVQMKVTGFTDDRGSAAVNDQLALARAQGLADWMQTQGIDGARIAVAGAGAMSPVASNDTPEGRAENRRIQVELDGLLAL